MIRPANRPRAGEVDKQFLTMMGGGMALVAVVAVAVFFKLKAGWDAESCASVTKSLSNVAITQTVYFDENKGRYAPDLDTLAKKSGYGDYMEIGDGVNIAITSVTEAQERTIVRPAVKASYTMEGYHESCKDEATGEIKVFFYDTAKGGLQK